MKRTSTNRCRASAVYWVVASSALLYGTASKADVPEIQPLFNIASPSPQADGQFGFSLSTIGNQILIGERRAGAEIGAAHLFTTSGMFVHTFANPTPAFGDHYSQFRGGLMQGVGAAQDLIAISDHGDDVGQQNSGSVHIYDASSFALLRTISNPTPVNGENFGADITTIPGTDLIVIGATHGGFGGVGPGEAFVYDARTGAQQLLISNPFPSTPDRFGHNVETVNNRIVVSAFTDDTAGPDAGAAYVFDGAGNLLHSLVSPRGPHYGFGAAMIGIPGTDLVAVSDSDDVTVAAGAGSIHIFSTADGSLVRTIDNPYPGFGYDHFGDQFGIIGDDLLVAATQADIGAAVDAGAVYRFDLATGDLVAVYLNPSPQSNNNFGTSISVVGSRLFIGSPGSDIAGGPGYVYVYDIAVPEPGTLAVLALMGVPLLRRRRARKG